MSALQLYLRSNLIWKINKIFSVKASVVTYECKRIRKKKLFIQANSKVTLHIWSWAWVVFGQSTPLYFKPFLGDGHLTFDGGMGYFRKKMQTDFEGGKSCKEIPGEEISCTETKKYLSRWKKKFCTPLYLKEKILSLEVWGKILTQLHINHPYPTSKVKWSTSFFLSYLPVRF